MLIDWLMTFPEGSTHWEVYFRVPILCHLLILYVKAFLSSVLGFFPPSFFSFTSHGLLPPSPRPTFPCLLVLPCHGLFLNVSEGKGWFPTVPIYLKEKFLPKCQPLSQGSLSSYRTRCVLRLFYSP